MIAQSLPTTETRLMGHETYVLEQPGMLAFHISPILWMKSGHIDAIPMS